MERLISREFGIDPWMGNDAEIKYRSVQQGPAIGAAGTERVIVGQKKLDGAEGIRGSQ